MYDLATSHVEYVNNAMMRIFDISHETFKHQPDFFINHVIEEDVEELHHQYEQFKQRSVVENVELHLKSHDKKVRTIMCNGYIIENKAIGFIKDISDVREHENYLENYGAKKNAILDMVSHNLSGPLHLTRQILSTIDTSIGTNEKRKVADQLKIIEDSTDHCIDIVNDLLEEEHLTSEFISLKKTKFDVVEKVNNLLERVRRTSSEKTYKFNTSVDSLMAYNDVVKFVQTVQNLLSNAVKFTPDKGVVEVTLTTTPNHFTISVQDSGIGIPASMQPLIFDKYTAAGRSGLRGEPSTGMGLYIVQKLTRLMDGKVQFESVENAGSKFSITIPINSSSS